MDWCWSTLFCASVNVLVFGFKIKRLRVESSLFFFCFSRQDSFSLTYACAVLIPCSLAGKEEKHGIWRAAKPKKKKERREKLRLGWFPWFTTIEIRSSIGESNRHHIMNLIELQWIIFITVLEGPYHVQFSKATLEPQTCRTARMQLYALFCGFCGFWGLPPRV